MKKQHLLGVLIVLISNPAMASNAFNESYIASSVGFIEGAVNTTLEIAKWADDSLDLTQVCYGLQSAVGANRPFMEEVSKTIALSENKASRHSRMLSDINYHLKAAYTVCSPDKYPSLKPFH
ncbi:hypothetical protein [Ferrimonas marina]|uniref:hypothetical protein n=1 Tax=Ferrimonas marina TaxID=299255 RepID=UPI001160E581|nr:hypothetical protein [Ferrimonas marina]